MKLVWYKDRNGSLHASGRREYVIAPSQSGVVLKYADLTGYGVYPDYNYMDMLSIRDAKQYANMLEDMADG